MKSSAAYVMPAFYYSSEYILQNAIIALGISKESIISKKRNAKLIACKYIVAYISKKISNETYFDIGKTLNINYSTTIHGVKLVTDLLKVKDPLYTEIYNKITKKLAE